MSRAPRPSLPAFAVAALALALCGCPKRVASPTSVLEAAAQRADQADADARTLALAGFHDWLYAAEPARAHERLERALGRDASEPWALYGLHLLARRGARLDEALGHALALVERAPDHPLAVTAARYAFNAVGTSPAKDERIVKAAGAALEKTPPGDTAHLLRSARALVHQHRGDPALAASLAELGVVDRWAVLGPFSPWTILAFDLPLPPETDGGVEGPFSTPFGEVHPRTLHFRDGRASLAGEVGDGNLFVLAADVTLPAGGTYVLRTVSSASHRVLVDGRQVVRRARFARAESTVSAAVVDLEAGVHRVMVVLSRDDGVGTLTLSVMGADGRPTSMVAAAARGPAPAGWAQAPSSRRGKPRAGRHVFPDAEGLATALQDEVGPALSSFVAVRDGMVRDPDGARRVALPLLEGPNLSPALLALRAELWLEDGNLPARVARARATRDLEAALDRDPNDAGALLLRARLALEDGRHQEAGELLKRARAVADPPPPAVALVRARLDLALGLDAQAEARAREALGGSPGHCDALALLYDLARRREAAQAADEYVEKLQGCPGALGRQAEHARWRGRTERAIRLQEALYAQDPSQLGSLHALVALYVSARRFDDALARLEEALKAWPRSGDLLKRMADVHEFAGRRDTALRLRERALAFSGGDLALRRAVHRARTGRELLEEHAVDGDEALARYREQPGSRDVRSVLVLDAAAVEAFADGSRVDRIHIIQRALSQDGVSQVAEVHLPAGAAVLQLRTIKQDGTVLEPEDIEGKDSISMPGVEVGDYVQYEYLEAYAPRGPAQPGFAAPAFYFQLAEVPNVWSRYVVLAPKGTALKVDAHNMKARPVNVEGEHVVYRHEERHVPAYLPEPNAPPSGNEFLPWVQAGAGATGNDGLITLYGDAFGDRARLTSEVEAFAHAAAAGKKGEDAVRAVHAAVMQRIQGRDAGLAASAAGTLAQGRGSRLWTLKAALEALGIPTRVAAIRTIHVDPKPYLFPNEALLPYVALRAELPGGRQVWLDPAVRFGPFGRLPEQAEGQRAWLFPEPGRPLEETITPVADEREGKRVTLELTLLPDGTLVGEGEERYVGFEGAQLSEGLEGLPPDRREQALQTALARYFGGAEMDRLELDLITEVGQPLVVRYRFRAPGFARPEGDRLVLGPLTFPASLGRRFVQLGRRTTPLFLEGGESTVASLRLTLPEGRAVEGLLGELKIESDFGHFIRRESQKGRVVTLEEDFRLKMGRVQPPRYDDFAHFAGQVDLLQSRDLVVR
jgi:tetratricopeptide (TPR) repeat protein